MSTTKIHAVETLAARSSLSLSLANVQAGRLGGVARLGGAARLGGWLGSAGWLDSAERYAWAKRLQAPIDLVEEVAASGRLPVPLFCAGGLATPADASLVMQLGAEAVFVGSGIFKSADPPKRAKAIVEATAHFADAEIVAKVSHDLGDPMPGAEISTLEVKLADRGW